MEAAELAVPVFKAPEKVIMAIRRDRPDSLAVVRSFSAQGRHLAVCLWPHGIVKISFFGGLTLGQRSPPDVADGNSITVASLLDLFGMKCATVPRRNEAKDYQDIHALLTKSGINLAEGIAAARAIYGRQYNPLLTLQALAYFDDLGEALPAGVKRDLLAAVKSVSLDNIPARVAPLKIGEGIQRP